MPSIIRRAIGTRDKFLILGGGSSEIFYRANGLMPRLISRVMEGFGLATGFFFWKALRSATRLQ